MSGGAARRGAGGYTLVALLASVTIMLILMGAATPTWKYIMQDDREQELLFRGGQIADAVAAYQKKNANALPVSLEVLVKGRFLRKAFKDPMTSDGKWRMIRPGEATGVPGGVGAGGPTTGSSPQQAVAGAPALPGAPPGTSKPMASGSSLGPFVGVASTNTDASLRIMNGRTRYNEWLFVAGQRRAVGAQPPAGINPAAQSGGPGQPPPTPVPNPGVQQ